MHMRSLVVTLFVAGGLLAQPNGKLQLHFMDVGQADSAVLISPKGQVVLFDAGEDMRTKSCDKPLAYLHQIGIGKIDYVVISHYHFDHIGCLPQILADFPLTGTAYDRGDKYPGATYEKYVQAVGDHRKTAEAGQTIKLDEGTSSEVDLKVVAVNGAGISTTNENDLSVSVLVTFGPFKAEIGGDLSGANTGTYADIETTVAPSVGRLDVYKVHHHCSSYSSNEAWLTTTRPAVGIISTGDGNDYGHPAPDCVTRLHAQKVATYWTEKGAGATPEPGVDTVAGSVVVNVAPGETTYAVSTAAGGSATYAIAGAGSGGDSGTPVTPVVNPPEPVTPVAPVAPKYAWSKKSATYHYAECAMVARIAADKLVRGDTPPEGRKMHKNCPQAAAK